MGSEAEAGLVEFLNLWQSSYSLQQQIRRIVENDRTDSGLVKADSHPEDRSHSRLIDFEAIAPQVEKRLAQSYGGLSRKDLFILLDQYKSGKRDLGTYLLLRAWKKHISSTNKSPDIRLRRLTLNIFERAVIENRADFFRNLADVIEFLQDEEFKENGRWNHDPGHFWQFHLLLYILEHPKEKYVMREFGAYFEREVGASEMPSTKTIRAFCRENGIGLDSTRGAPKKSST